MGRERAICYSQMVRSNEGCVFVAGRKLCCVSGNVVILFKYHDGMNELREGKL